MIKFVRINWALMCNNSPRPCYCSIRAVIDINTSNIHTSFHISEQSSSQSCSSRTDLPALGVCRCCVFHIKKTLLLILHLQMWCFLRTKNWRNNICLFVFAYNNYYLRKTGVTPTERALCVCVSQFLHSPYANRTLYVPTVN